MGASHAKLPRHNHVKPKLRSDYQAGNILLWTNFLHASILILVKDIDHQLIIMAPSLEEPIEPVDDALSSHLTKAPQLVAPEVSLPAYKALMRHVLIICNVLTARALPRPRIAKRRQGRRVQWLR